MFEPLIRSFCEHKHRWPIVIFVTFGIGLVILLPLVDEYFAGKDRQIELAESLRKATEDVSGLEDLQARCNATLTELEAYEKRTVPNAGISAYRERLVELARQSHCQLRRISAGNATERVWLQHDNPLVHNKPASKKDKPTGLLLHNQSLTFSVVGTTRELEGLLKKIEEDRMLMHVSHVTLRPEGTHKKKVNLELELQLFTLVEKHKI